MPDEKRPQRLYDGDKHGPIESVLVENQPSGNGSAPKYAEVTVFVRGCGKARLQCAATQADEIARRLTTPTTARNAPGEEGAG